MTSRIAIIGGGFSGVMTAANLARLARQPIRVTIINTQRPTGRGVAYGTRRTEHLLNVAARNMSAFPDQPDHFLQWLRTRSDYDAVPTHELRERFIPRMVYGDYLLSIAHHYLQTPDGLTSTKVEFREDTVTDIEPNGEMHLQSGGRLTADRIVLACGNEIPAALPGAESLTAHPAWVGNPWESWHQRLPAHGGSVVLLGAGLTTVDAVLTLRALGWHGAIHAISRHGWLPHAHFRGVEYPNFPPAEVDLAELGLTKLLALMEEHCARLRDLGANPAIIVDKMRPHTQRIWQRLSLDDRLTFASKWAARWNVLRHRIAPEIHAQVTSAQLTGQLEVHAANIVRLEAANTRVRVHLSDGPPVTGDLVINATGPQSRFSATRSGLLQNLLQRGLITSDDMDMGVRVAPDHIAIDSTGQYSSLLLALGPLLKGTLWETVAVPELRGQARRVAETLLGQPPTLEAEEAVMEYMI
ncbi:conserved hypothetical protein [Chthoniobacter flavus Ellin428]|uniref:FAD-dependent urate hydroxylase HpyO/Asp monooxygenase CreE-like FAD/NAD(P)-binding domain-containing protein n=1 Tax=Chthoniobacter flavus Ellin428 TaxID=497964 RepID=B4D0V2_9BACT|nr:FAD/NAD(P)-binding protein [Chthoniobacter flavus]EDY19964.1 conserved hypothetical protein [Chthoniobacter flavus Ellin428]TCO91767.1 putative NAD(P)/FAD-binding protein YdhS [Chthoniobacter flavus]